MKSPLARITALAVAAPLAYSLIEPYRLAVRHFTVTLPHLPDGAEGLRIAQLSDLHCSALTSPGVVREAVALCNAQKPHVVALTGDFVSRRDSYAMVTLARFWARPVMEYAAATTAELARLEAPEGIFAVPGNHDHSGGCCDAIGSLLETAGITVLLNRHVWLREVLPLIGVDDLRAGRPDFRRACAEIAPEQAQVILSHNPRFFSLVTDRNCLVISGHTHGGQVHLPLTSFRRRPNDMHGSPWNEGWYCYGPAQMYVSRGVGSVHFPMRFRCPPEIVIFTLRRV